jgi:hypothetical protein
LSDVTRKIHGGCILGKLRSRVWTLLKTKKDFTTESTESTEDTEDTEKKNVGRGLAPTIVILSLVALCY